MVKSIIFVLGHIDGRDRAASFCVCRHGAIGLVVLPGVLAVVGLTGLYLLVRFSLAALLLIGRIPAGLAPRTGGHSGHPALTLVGRGLSVASILLFFCGSGPGGPIVACHLTVAGIASAFTASMRGARLGRWPSRSAPAQRRRLVLLPQMRSIFWSSAAWFAFSISITPETWPNLSILERRQSLIRVDTLCPRWPLLRP